MRNFVTELHNKGVAMKGIVRNIKLLYEHV